MSNSVVSSVQELIVQRPLALPERYIASPEERPSVAKHSGQHGIPVIDMSPLRNSTRDEARQAQMTNLAKACEEWGFFQVVNHGIQKSLTDRTRRVVREFFQLSAEEKKECAQQEASNGVNTQGYGPDFGVSEDQRLDWEDMLFLRTLPAHNRNMGFWPTKPADFRETVAEYATETGKLGDELLSLLAENLGLTTPDYFVRSCGEWWENLRMNYYPPCPRPDLVLGLSPHSDESGITMLLQDDRTEGLHVRKDGEWIAAQIIPDALVINIGDTLEIMSNGRYKSVEHRAVTNKEKDRVSIAAFYGPRPDIEIGPAPDLIDDLHPCRYRRIQRAEYLAHYLGKRQDGKEPLDFVKLSK